jgi:hypothetical protein
VPVSRGGVSYRLCKAVMARERQSSGAQVARAVDSGAVAGRRR